MQQPDQWQYLLQQYLEDKATDEERQQLLNALQRQDIDWEELLLQAGLQQEQDADYREADWTAMIEGIVQQPVQKRKVFYMNRWWMAAAALLLAVCCLWIVLDHNQAKEPVVAATGAHDIMPGKQGAVLTLADGKQVVIDSAGNGNIAQQGSVVVTQHDGQLVYRKEEESKKVDEGSAPIAFNMLSTPKGRQFQLTLPDGSQVWLDAASSIRYPVSFTGDERRVEITGQAYFEVEKNPAKPFRVAIFTSPGNQTAEVEVLGTHFNINAYSDEQVINTTLLEGKVKVVNRQSSIGNEGPVILHPGQQASIIGESYKSSKILVQTVDAEASIAWKNGFFNFQDASLQQVMRQLARWYDVDVKYESTVPNIEFGGKMGRDLTLSNVLHFLEKSGLHCTLENNHTLIVKP